VFQHNPLLVKLVSWLPLNSKIQITMEISLASNGKLADSEENSNIDPEKKTKHRTPTIKMEGPAYSSRGRNRPNMA
jgi:hypothetical protein